MKHVHVWSALLMVANRAFKITPLALYGQRVACRADLSSAASDTCSIACIAQHAIAVGARTFSLKIFGASVSCQFCKFGSSHSNAFAKLMDTLHRVEILFALQALLRCCRSAFGLIV